MVGSNVCVVILGDIGRSPRMMYHSLSLAKEGHKVDIIGYNGVKPLDELNEQPLVSFHYLNPYPEWDFIPKFINYPFKAVWQAVTLFFLLLINRKPHFILVQNPPAVPTLFVCYICKLLLGCKLIIDWHNYAYTIMALSCGPENVLVKFTKYMEKYFGAKADYNMCVTKAMRQDLKDLWQIEATTLYDRPASQFRPISIEEKHRVMIRLGAKHPELLNVTEKGTETLFTRIVNGEVSLIENRPGILISSTSWTQDEDFGVLLDVLDVYEESRSGINYLELPKLVCIITGKGDMKEYYKNIIKNKNWKHVIVLTPWLDANDYPLVLASADIGVSLHTSSSGLDLPMKVVDLFGCCIPVCAYNFKCLGELVEHAENGYVFNSKEELTQKLLQWFTHFPNDETQNEVNERFRKKLEDFRHLSWHENWKKNAGILFK